MKKNDLLSNFPDMIKKYWDYDKNADNPKDVLLDSEKKYFWKDETGSFQLSPIELVKKNVGTSFNEQAIYFYCKKVFNEVFNRYKYKSGTKSVEIDIYIPEIKLAIEYDGVFWHRNKLDRDIEKNQVLAKDNIYTLRIREKDLPKIEAEKAQSIVYDLEEDFSIVINKIFNVIIQHIMKNANLLINDMEKQSVLNFHLTMEMFENDKVEILNQYRTTYVENNITKTCLIKYWDKEKNLQIIPQKIAPTDNIKIWFKCNYGFSKAISVASIQSSHKIQCLQVNEEICKNCKRYYCPFVNYCNAEISNRNRNFNLTMCNSLMRFCFHQILDENVDLNSIGIKYDEECIDDSQTYEECQNIYQFYYAHKQELLKSSLALKKLRKVFNYINLTPIHSKNLEELADFLSRTQLYVHKINYLDFDNNDVYIKWLIQFLKEYVIKNKRYDLLEIPIVDQYAISKELLSELKVLVKDLQRRNKYSVYQDLLKQYEDLLRRF